MSSLPEEVTRFFPTIPAATEDSTIFDAPVCEVSVLEDRAQVTRQGTQEYSAGRHRLVVWGVSPLLQNVSLRATSATEGAQVLDVRAHRAYRVRRDDKPEERRAIDQEIQGIDRRFAALADGRERTEARRERTFEMLEQGAAEIPEDAAWGHVNQQAWHDTFEPLFQRARDLLEESIDDYFTQSTLIEEREQLAHKRQALSKMSHEFVACVVIDVVLETDAALALSLHYVVPNALWRPLHSARLTGGTLQMTSCATVWQQTGEDWINANLSFSTARSSLGTEAPKLSDDLMHAQRKRDELIVSQREVAIQSTGPEGGGASQAPQHRGIVLPGVDDGGDLQQLKAKEPCVVVSDGLPHTIPLFSFSAPAETKRVCMPELDNKVFVKSTQANQAPHPLLAGPVELLQDYGQVGWTRILFVAAGERFDLNFGPDDGVRVTRTTEQESKEDPIDHWGHRTTSVTLYLSNLEAVEKTLTLTERIPVSEVAYVKVALDEEESDPVPTLDENGFCTWTLTLAPHETRQLSLVWTLSTAPDVQGI